MFSVRKSKIIIDLVQYPDSDTDPGLGLFQVIDGQFAVPVFGLNVESIDKTEVHPDQKKYMMDSGHNEDKVIVPTLQSIRTGNIQLGFRVQHSSVNPTHKMDWMEDHRGRDYPHSFPILLPLRELQVDPVTELTFNYNLH